MRAELSGDIERLQRVLQEITVSLERLDATLLLFDPSYKVAGIKPKAFRPPPDWSKRGEMTRLILGILRRSTEVMTSRDIALQLMTERALDSADEKLLLIRAEIPEGDDHHLRLFDVSTLRRHEHLVFPRLLLIISMFQQPI
ncbi:MAG TPA: hypothetical protein VIG52_02175 [Methyloceanibacter sp.]|jgi:hypothetical protein